MRNTTVIKRRFIWFNLQEVCKPADNADNFAKALKSSNVARGLGKAFEKVGQVSGWLDAGVAAYDAVVTIGDRNATTGQKVGTVAKALFKTGMTFVKTNPVVGLVLGVTD
ncbi:MULTISPECIES: hypothetical protein [unclassified Paraflavitalea]|uniref:hypothetical protein n=1 Tax=unclassified Paraflavitalea TaxID=2798305 RepID=UPI003D324E39